MASRFLGYQEFVEVQHPEIDGVGEVPIESLDHWRSLGWDLVSEQNSEDNPESEWTEPAVSEEDDHTTRSDA